MPDRWKLMLTREAICSGLNTIKSAYERCEEDHDIVYFVGEYGTGQVAHRVSVPTLLSDTIDLLEEQDAVEQKTGRWIYKKYDDMFMCSSCGKYSIRNDYPYCHWCGAKMEQKGGDGE